MASPLLKQKWVVWVVMLPVIMGYAAAFAQSPVVGMAVLMTTPILLVGFLKPFWIILAYIFTSAWATFLNLPITQDGLALSTVVLVTGMMVLLVRALLTRDADLVLTPFVELRHILVVLLLFLVILSLVNARSIEISIQEVKRFTFCVLAYFLAVSTIKGPGHLRKVVLWMVGAGLLVSLCGAMEAADKSIYSIFNFRSLFGAPVYQHTEKWVTSDRIGGLIGSSNGHGAYMGLIFIFSFYLFLETSSKLFRSALGIGIVITFINMIGTGSRGPLAALLISLCIFWFFLKVSRRWLLAIIGMFIVVSLTALIFISDINVERIFVYEGKQQSSAELRWKSGYIAMMMVKDHPILGSGPNGFLSNYYRYAFQVLPEATKKTKMRIHNAYIEVLVNYGIIAFTVFMTFNFLTIKALFSALHHTTGRGRCLVVSVLCAVCYYSIYMLFTGWLVNAYYWMIMGVGNAVGGIYRFQVSGKSVFGTEPLTLVDSEKLVRA